MAWSTAFARPRGIRTASMPEGDTTTADAAAAPSSRASRRPVTGEATTSVDEVRVAASRLFPPPGGQQGEVLSK